MKKIVRLTESDLARIVRRVINEEMESANDNWSIIYSGLKSFTDVSGNRPKIIPFMYEGKKITSLNWGNHSDAGRKKPWGISVSSDDQRLNFGTEYKDTAELYKKLTGKSTYFDGKYYSDDLTLDYSNPQNVISTVKKIITGLK